jgi:diguanylate cyclase (GGDEF)-like protein
MTFCGSKWYLNKLLRPSIGLILSSVIFCNLADSEELKSQPSLFSEINELNTQDNISLSLKHADSIRRSHPLKFQKILRQLSGSKNLNQEQQHFLNFLIGYDLTFNGQFNNAEIQLKSILASDASKTLKFRANYTLVHIFAAKKMWFEGLKTIDTNIKLASKINNIDHIQAHLVATVIFYKRMKQYDLSLHYIKTLSALPLAPKLQCVVQHLFIESRFHLGQITSSDKEIYNALQSCKKVNDAMVTSIIRVYQARIYLSEKNTYAAINSLLPFLNEIKSTHYPELITDASNVLAEAYWQAEDFSKSKHFSDKALLHNVNNSNINQAAKTYKLLYQIAKREDVVTLALSYHEQYAALDKIDSDDIENKHLAFQLAKNKNLVQQNEIALLSEKNNLLKAKQELAETKLANRHLFLALLSFIIVILTLFGLRLWRDHKRVKELAEYDQLTGIFNRGHFTQIALRALKYCQSAEQDLSIIVFDLDHFKKVNDSFGHLCGDWALKEVSKACQAIGRKNDIFARLGGEEFCIMLPSCNIRMAALRAEACRAAIEAIITETSGYEFTITASFGVTDVCLSDFNLDKLLADADAAAYQSKHAGRNQVTVHQVKDAKKEQLSNSTLVISKRAT